MALSQNQYRDIMNEYDQIRRDNYNRMQDHIEEVYGAIPEMKEIDDRIASESLAAARRMLFQPQTDERAALHEKISSLILRKRELLIRNHYPADYMDPVYQCPCCKDTGYVDNQKCACFEQRIMDILYRQSNLNDSLRDQNFRTFRMDYYSRDPWPGKSLSPWENMSNVREECYKFIENFSREPGQNLLIHGNSGVGKTFLTTCIAGEIIRSGKSVVYMTAYQLFEQLADYTFRRKEDNEGTLPFLMDTDLLIIDDLGTEMNNAFINSQLFLCINERILNKKSTIISTNFSLKELSSTYSERVSSRLIQFYTILHIYGEDIRIKKAFSPID